MKKVPFRLLPGSWGLKGRAYDEAEACYLLEGEALDRRIAEIRHATDPRELARQIKLIDLKYEHITAYEFDVWQAKQAGAFNQLTDLDLQMRHERIDATTYEDRRIEIMYPEGLDREIARVDLRLMRGEIKKREHEKEIATLKGEPYIGIIDDGMDPKLGINSVFFEFDWNEHWIEMLRSHGFEGRTEEDIIQQWFQSVCRSVVAEEMMENGGFDLGLGL